MLESKGVKQNKEIDDMNLSTYFRGVCCRVFAIFLSYGEDFDMGPSWLESPDWLDKLN